MRYERRLLQTHGHDGVGAPSVEEGRPASVRPEGSKSARAKDIGRVAREAPLTTHGHDGVGAPSVEEGRPASVRPEGSKSARAKKQMSDVPPPQGEVSRSGAERRRGSPVEQALVEEPTGSRLVGHATVTGSPERPFPPRCARHLPLSEGKENSGTPPHVAREGRCEMSDTQ